MKKHLLKIGFTCITLFGMGVVSFSQTNTAVTSSTPTDVAHQKSGVRIIPHDTMVKPSSGDTIMGIPYFIRTGEGTGGVKLDVSTIDDVKRLFGDVKITRESSKRGGQMYTDRALNYKKKGLKFFALDDPSNVIYAIEVSMKGARTERDVIVGTSTQDDVLKAYGEPSYRSAESLEYEGIGVLFQFNKGLLTKVLLNKKIE